MKVKITLCRDDESGWCGEQPEATVEVPRGLRSNEVEDMPIYLAGIASNIMWKRVRNNAVRREQVTVTPGELAVIRRVAKKLKIGH